MLIKSIFRTISSSRATTQGGTKRRKSLFGMVVAACALALSFTACSDNVDDSNLYVFNGQSAYSFCNTTEGLKNFAYLCTQVRLSKKSQSTFSDLLSARGNYTVFAPTDDAIQQFLDSVTNTPRFDFMNNPDTVAKYAEYIVRNAIIDNGNNEPYLSTTFTVGALGYPNMNDRYIQIDYDVDENSRTVITVNSKSRIVTSDEEVSNGIVHSVDNVIDMSSSTLPDLIHKTPNLRIFSHLLEATGWADSLVAYRDEYYEDHHPEFGSIDLGNTSAGQIGRSPEHRYYGFTAFIEPDSVFVQKWGIPQPQFDEKDNILNWNEIDAAFDAKCREAYPFATGDDLTKQDNAVNQFVSYHLLPFSATWKNLVVHHSELGYSFKNPSKLSINCWEYYETFGKPRRLIKFTEGESTDGKRINRYSKYDNKFYGTYRETDVPRPGILVSQSNGAFNNNALNGFYYTIDDVLVYDDDVPGKVLNERLRFDVASFCPDLMTNGLRQVEDNNARFIPNGYLSTFWYTEETNWRYVPYHTEVQDNMQGDEVNINGRYDFTFKLPPVPYEGTWELRMCAPEIAHFGMFQVYLGTDRLNPAPIGLPLDFRIVASNPVIGWQADTNEESYNREIDRTMRNHGYMKNNKHAARPTGGGVTSMPLRAASGDYIRLRKILWSGNMKPQETYYVRIKSVLDNTRTVCMLDYIEMVPKNVYAGEEAEDPW